MSEKVSIEIGRNILKISQGSFNKNRLFVRKYTEIIVEEPIIMDDTRVNIKLLSDILENNYISNNFLKKNINVVLSGLPNMLIREMILPNVPEEKTYPLLQFEARQHFPVNMDNYLIDYKQISIFEENKQKKQKILLVAVPKSIIAGIVEVFKNLNLKIKKIDIEANVLTKMINYERNLHNEDKNSLIMVLNLMRYFVTAIIIDNQNIVLAKTFPNYDLERMFKEGNDYGMGIENMYMYVINEIIENIVKFYDFYKSREQEPKLLSKIYLTGEVCQHFDISTLLGSKIESEIELLTNLNFIENKVILNKTDLCSYSTSFSGLI